jgi:hypothetical protein
MPRANGWLCALLLSLGAASCASPAGPAALPSWVAAYPGANLEAGASSKTPNGLQHDFTFRTSDDAEKILNFYQRQLMQGGLHMESRGGGEYGGMLTAEDDSRKRGVTVDIHAEKGASAVTISVVEK